MATKQHPDCCVRVCLSIAVLSQHPYAGMPPQRASIDHLDPIPSGQRGITPDESEQYDPVSTLVRSVCTLVRSLCTLVLPLRQSEHPRPQSFGTS